MQYLLRSTKQEVLQLQLFHTMWRKEAIPQEFKDASIIHLFKWKRNPQLCDNYRGFSLLSIAGKVLARVLLNRLNEHLEQSRLLPESQCGFRKDRGTIKAITARQLQEKFQERNSQSQRSLENYGEVWLSDRVHSNGEAVPQWYAGTGPK